MKSRTKTILALALSCGLMIAGCGKSSGNPDEQEESKPAPVEFNGIDQVEATLKNAGWNVLRPDPSSFHLWEDQSPVEFLIAENSSGNSLVFAKFANTDQALEAYDSTVPINAESSTEQNTEQYKQTLVKLDDESGDWVFRTSENWIVGVFLVSADQETAMIQLIESLQTAPSISAPEIPASEEDPTKSE